MIYNSCKIERLVISMKKIGIIVAMDEEREEIVNIMKDIEVKQIYNLRFLQGKIKEKECILIKCGVGKVNAARATQVMLDHFKIDYVINIGVAGALNGMLDIGDVVIAKKVIQHDFDITAFGHSKGYISGVGAFIESNSNLVDEFEEVIQGIPEREYKIKMGIVATGDIFCTETWMKDKIRAKFNADVIDMECGAIAQVCYLNEKPFIAIRSVSDSPNGKNVVVYDNNLKFAAKRCANVLKEFLE